MEAICWLGVFNDLGNKKHVMKRKALREQNLHKVKSGHHKDYILIL